MVLIDYSNLSFKMLYVAISQTRPRKINGKYNTHEFIQIYYHLMLNFLKNIPTRYHGYGDIVLALDDKHYWREDFYPAYKKSRKDKYTKGDIDFKEFRGFTDEFEVVLQKYFPYKLIKSAGAEGDDVIGVLAKKYAPLEKTIVISGDKDMKQVLEYGSALYDANKKERVIMSPKELKAWKIEHILLGDSIDDIPHIKRGTEFTDKFISYLKENEVYIKTPMELNVLSISKKLYSEYNIYKVKKNGDITDTLDIFKSTRFGKTNISSFTENLLSNLKSNPIYAQNFKRNMKLVLFSEIPDDIREGILEAYDCNVFEYDPNGITQFLRENKLNTLLLSMTDFYVEANRSKRLEEKSEAISEWF